MAHAAPFSVGFFARDDRLSGFDVLMSGTDVTEAVGPDAGEDCSQSSSSSESSEGRPSTRSSN
jgi:hypothetical protein